MATKSKFSDVLSKIAFVIAVLLTLFQSYTALFGVLTAVYQRAIHLGLASSYIFLFNMANPKEKGKVFHIIINFIGLVASAGSNFYICLHYAEIQGRLGITTELDMIFGALLLVAILIMGYESLGWALPTISVIFLLYGLFGHLIPGALSHQAFTFKRLISDTFCQGCLRTFFAVIQNQTLDFVAHGFFARFTEMDFDAVGGLSDFLYHYRWRGFLYGQRGSGCGGAAVAGVVVHRLSFP